METKLQAFYNEESNVNIRMEQVDNEPWFVAKDVANALEITWSGHTLDSIPEEWKGVVKLTTPSSGTRGGGEQSLTVINEAALYKLAFRSNKPQADAFVNWVTGEVLPAIRRTGSYGQAAAPERKKLPQPKYRPYFEEWKQRVRPYISRDELEMAADQMEVTLAHVRKVYVGTTMSERIVREITDYARYNRKHGVIYPEREPVHRQMVIDWDEEYMPTISLDDRGGPVSSR